MRKAFVSALCELAKSDKKIFLLTGDLGFNILEPFINTFPDRFLNVGVAEANLISVAAGLSTAGFIPFVYSIATFVTMRAFEQIRDTICLQNLNVKIIGVGAGFAYAKAGPTHHSIEDIALMRTFKNMAILVPSDPIDTYAATKAAAVYKGPCYIRIERNPDTNVYATPHTFQIGKAKIIKEGAGVALIATGSQAAKAVTVSRQLAGEKIASTVYAFSSIRPFDKKMMEDVLKKHKIVATIEEHTVSGGLATEVMECIIDKQSHVKLLCFGIQSIRPAIVADYEKMIAHHNFSSNQITNKIKSEF